MREFGDEWLRGGPPADEPPVGSADIQTFADLGNRFELVRSMRVVPFTRDTVLQLASVRPRFQGQFFNLRSDPFEQADNHTLGYDRWMAEHFFLMVPAQEYVGQFLGTFKEFPPRQKVGSFGINQVLENLTKGASDR